MDLLQTETPWVLSYQRVGFRSRMQKNNYPVQVLRWNRFLLRKSFSKFRWSTASCLLILFTLHLAGCQSSNLQSKSSLEKAKIYEQRAKTFQTLSDLQRLSSPYSISNGRNRHSSLHNENLRMAYHREAKRYRKMAEQIRSEHASESNASKAP